MATHDYPKHHVLETIRKYTIGDGLNIVVDPDRSEGSWVHDQLTNNRLLDCYTQFASMPLGWNHPRLVKAAAHLGKIAIHKFANSDMYCPEYADFIQEFAYAAKDFQHFFFIDGGTLAVENSLKAAFDYKMKKLGETHDYMANSLDVIHMEQAFHGRSGYSLSLTNTLPVKIWGFPKFKWTRLTNPCLGEGQERRTEISLMQAEEAMRKGHVAALIIEPIQGEGGDVHFPEKYLHDLRQLCYQYDVLFIVDEVQTGVGLTGKYWAYEHFDLKPDLMCFGKKTQVCGFAATHKLAEVENNVFEQSSRINSTWGGNIVDMARFVYIHLAIQEEKLVENAASVGDYFLRMLKDSHLFDHARGRGLMIAFDLPTKEDRDRFLQKLSKRMLALKCGDRSVRLRPPLTFSKDDADKAMEFISEASKS
jgi:L-lysine 6-transaminase